MPVRRPSHGDSRPPWTLHALEAPRAFGEYAALAWSIPLLDLAPRGDGSPVVVLPGFTGSDRSTAVMRTFLRHTGHRPVAWGLGNNLGPSRAVLDGIDALVQRVVDAHGAPVQLVGWSLGGIYARRVAARHPERVRRVITLGSPYRLTDTGRSHADWLYRLCGPLHDAADEIRPGGLASQPLPVPTTSVYSRTDGIVPWQTCLEPESGLAENVAVHGSHNGLGHNPQALLVIADRLALPPGQLPRFTPPLAWRAAFLGA